MNYLRIQILTLSILLSFSSLFCQPQKITILHTNDMHASFVPHEASWVRNDPKPMVGGFLELNRLIDSIRSVKDNVLLLDAGDVMTGNPIAEMEYKGAIGGALFEMMNMMGYEAWTIGNHDLDISQENLLKLTKIAKFPTLSANLVDSAETYPLNNQRYVILTKDGLKVGIIGIMSNSLFELTNTNNLKGLKVLSAVETTQKLINEIDPKTELIIALTHQGIEDDSILAVNVKNLDVIIGSHSHTRLKSPKKINGVIICQTGAYCENLGELELEVENDKVVASNGSLHTLWTKSEYSDNEFIQFVKEYEEKVKEEYSQVVGKTKIDLRRSRSGESNIGRFVADAILEGSNADFSVINSSGIRKDILAGDIRKVDLFEVSPFRNYLCSFPIKGRDVKTIINRYIESLENGRTSLDFAGIRCEWKNLNGKIEITSLIIKGAQVKDDENYICGTIDFVINQANKYLEYEPKNIKSTQILLFDALVNKVKKDGVIKNSFQNNFQKVQ